MHLRNERAGGIDDAKVSLASFALNRRRDAVRAENCERTVWDLVEPFDKDDAART